ncbi:mechanosensitive ion channel family protein [Candidatus Undinarchaeota archaeon]
MDATLFFSLLEAYGIPAEWVYGSAVILFGLVFGRFVSRSVSKFLIDYSKKTHTSVDDLIVGIFAKPLAVIAYLVGIWGGLYIAGINPQNLGFFYNIYQVLLISIATYAVIVGFKSFWIQYRIHIRRRGESAADKIIIPLGGRLIPLIMAITGIFIMLSVLGINITPFLAGAGLVGLALALAAQTPLSNFFSGILLTINRPFDLGHRIEIVGKYLGDIVEIGTFSTKLRTLENNIVVIPNVQLTQMELINHDLTDDRVKLKIPVNVAYGTDAEKVEKILHKVIKGIDGIVESPLDNSSKEHAKTEAQSGVYFVGYGDFALNFVVIVWIKNTRIKFKIQNEINTKIQKEFKKAGIKIPFPIREIYMHETGKSGSEPGY